IFRELADKDKRVRYISFSRNFGKEAGMYAGLKNSKGDFVVVMDADLQHPPAFLPQMYNYVKDGEFDCATTRRVSRTGESKVRSFFARMFYKIMNKISQTEIVDGAQDFRFMTRQMVDAVLAMSEYNRFSKGIFSWVGFRVQYMPYENVERPAGTTSWSFWGLFKYSLEGIMAFSTAPLSFSIFFAIFGAILSVLFVIAGIVSVFFLPALGAALLVIGALLLVGAVQLGCTGILGMYLGKTYMEVKNRPIYLTGETDEMYRERRKNADK
ncbi:MAG: glycosyltransferase family 2 protein, partial [Ruminococcus sp.]|nr:glycosyltransferase family 2 protein [Ruminococcus sp.]